MKHAGFLICTRLFVRPVLYPKKVPSLPNLKEPILIPNKSDNLRWNLRFSPQQTLNLHICGKYQAGISVLFSVSFQTSEQTQIFC